MNTAKDREDFDRLICKAFDDSLSTQEFVVLKKLLKDESNQKRYCKHVLIESLLHWEEIPSLTNEKTSIFEFRNWTLVSSIAAILVCIASAWFVHKSKHDFVNTPLMIAHKHTVPAEKSRVSYENPSSESFTHSNHNFFNKDLHIKNFRKYLRSISNKEYLEFEGKFTEIDGNLCFTREELIQTSAKAGVYPLVGSKMLNFRNFDLNIDLNSAESVETLRIYDLREESFEKIHTVDASIHFNQSFASHSDTTEFSISLHAISENATGDFTQLDVSSQSTLFNHDQTKWERVDSEIFIPEGTEYLIVSLSAKKYGPEALLANSQECFADDLQVNFIGI